MKRGAQTCVFAAVHARHAHLYDQCAGLIAAGARLKWIFDPEPAHLAALSRRFPSAKVARDLAEILEDTGVRLVTAAAIPDERAALGVAVMKAGKDYLTDKAPLISPEQLEMVRAEQVTTRRHYWVFYAGRWSSPAMMRATELVRDGAIGRPVQMVAFGPHRLSPESRPDWFFDRNRTGGILCDLGSHHFEMFLEIGGEAAAPIHHAAIANVAHPSYPDFDDYGEATVGAAGTLSLGVRVDWLSPAGLGTWGDARTLLLGTTGYIEVRPCIDVGRQVTGEHLFVVDGDSSRHLELAGVPENRFFSGIVSDCLAGTDRVQPFARVAGAATLAMRTEKMARVGRASARP